jgi:hypothetical protein
MLGEVGPAALADLGQAVVQRLDQQGAALRVVEQVVLQVGVAAHDPDVAQHLVQHARRAAGAAFSARSSSSTDHASSPSRRITISRSENDV